MGNAYNWNQQKTYLCFKHSFQMFILFITLILLSLCDKFFDKKISKQ